MNSDDAQMAVYLYCIAEGRPIAAGERLRPCRRIFSIAHQDLLGVASRVPLGEFGEEALHARLQDADWLEREVRGHERVIEKVMESRTVLPLKFCTIFLTEEKVRAFLERDQDEFRRALVRLRGREEWEVKMYCEPACPPGAQASETAAALSGREYLMQKGAAQLAAREADIEAHRQAQRTLEVLTGCVEEMQLRPLAAGQPRGIAKLVLDAVCLLAKPQFTVLRSRLDGLGNEVADKGLRFQLSGPWPPYHFSGEVQENVGPP